MGTDVRNIILLSIAIALTATGCDKKAEGQTVAVVNDEEITTNELNAELNSANLPSDLNKEEARSRILQSIIDRRLLTQQARKDGLDKSPEFLSRQRRLTDDLLISMLVSRQSNTAPLPAEQEIASFEASRPEMFAKREAWNLEQLQYDTPTDPALQQRIAATKSLEELAQVLAQGGVAFQRGRGRLDSAMVPHDIYLKITAAPQSEPFIVPAGKRSVASVIVSREPAPRSGPEARPAAVDAIRRQQSAKFVESRLKALRESAKIEYKEGFSPPKK